MADLSTFTGMFEQMGEYTRMETELPFAEFQTFYRALTEYLQKNFQDMTEEQLVQAKGMAMIVAGNAQMRALRKDENRKKFAKMGEKAKFWEDALVLRLTKNGPLTTSELDARVSALWNEQPAAPDHETA